MVKDQPGKLAVEGFFGSFDLISLAAKASDLKNSNDELFGGDVVIHDTSDSQIVRSSDRVTYDKSHRLTHDQSDRLYVTTSDSLTHDKSDSQIVTTSDRQINIKTCCGLTDRQKSVLIWLISECGEMVKLVTYKMINIDLGITERAARTQVETLKKKGFIGAKMATRPNSLQPIGIHINIKPMAHVAVALSNNHQCSDVVTHDKSDRQIVTTSYHLTHDKSDRHTLCSSSKDTTTEEKTSLDLGEWEGWGLRESALSEFTHLGSDLLTDLLDKTAYVIKQREGSSFCIQNKIGFLRKCLRDEFCEVDDKFETRGEKLARFRTAQMRRDVEKIKAARVEEKKIAVELFELKLSERDRAAIREKAIGQIRAEMKKPNLIPSDELIVNFEKNIILEMVDERKEEQK